MATSELLKKMTKVPICRGLKESEVAELCALADETSARRGETLFREGDPGDTLLVVLEGTVEVTKKSRLLAKMGEGSVLGEMSLLGGSTARSASVQATTDVKLLRIASKRFSEKLASDAVFAFKVVANLAQVLSRRLYLMDEKLVETLDRGKKKEELADFQRILSNWQF